MGTNLAANDYDAHRAVSATVPGEDADGVLPMRRDVSTGRSYVDVTGAVNLISLISEYAVRLLALRSDLATSRFDENVAGSSCSLVGPESVRTGVVISESEISM